MNNKLEFSIEVIIEKDGKEFHAFCPALRGLHAYGRTENEAADNAVELARLYILSLVKHKEPIPLGVQCKEVAGTSRRIGRKPIGDCITRNLILDKA